MSSLIAIDPAIQGGRPVIAGTRVTVDAIVRAVAAGDPLTDVASAYRVSVEQVGAALEYAADLVATERAVALPG